MDRPIIPHLSCAVPHAYLADLEEERCVLLMGTRASSPPAWFVTAMVPVPNSAGDPTEKFEVRQSAIDAAQFLHPGLDVLGVIHSHLPRHGPWPSEADFAGVVDGMVYAVYSTADGSLWWY